MENPEAVVNTPEEQNVQDDADTRAAETPAETPETVENPGDDGPKEESREKEFAHALNKRMEAEKKKWEKDFQGKYAGDLELAGTLRKMYAGKSDEEISKALFEENVKRMAAEEGVPEAFARRMLQLEMDAPRKAEPPKKKDDRTDLLLQQINDIKENDDVDMMQVLEKDEFIREKVGSGAWDINRAYAHYVSSSKKKNAPPVARGGARSASAPDFEHMSTEEFNKYRERLKRGEHIKLGG